MKEEVLSGIRNETNSVYDAIKSLAIHNEIKSVYEAISTATEHIIDYIKQIVDEEGTIVFNMDNIEEKVIINNDDDNYAYSVSKRTYRYKTKNGKWKKVVKYFVETEYNEIDIEFLHFDDIVAIAEAIEFHFTGTHNDEDE